MDKQQERKYLDVQRTAWWQVARRDMISRLMEHFNRDATVLDIGCSGGALIELLQKKGFRDIHGIDISPEAIAVCRERKIINTRMMDAEDLLFPDHTFASDVLEHLANQERALAAWRRIIKTGGTLIVFVPAYQFLWSRHDDIARHKCRYQRSELLRVLNRAQFDVIRISGWNVFLFLPITSVILVENFFERLLRINSETGHVYNSMPFLNVLLIRLLETENSLLSKFNSFFGVSFFVVCKAR
jgi:SAM-dependent methyltransferase